MFSSPPSNSAKARIRIRLKNESNHIDLWHRTPSACILSRELRDDEEGEANSIVKPET